MNKQILREAFTKTAQEADDAEYFGDLAGYFARGGNCYKRCEVRGCVEDIDEAGTATGVRHVYPGGKESPEFYSLYLVDAAGYSECIGDFKSLAAALYFENLLNAIEEWQAEIDRIGQDAYIEVMGWSDEE